MDQPSIVPPRTKVLSAEKTPESEPPENYAFVMNVSRLVGATSFTLDTGHELRRANSQEISAIRDTVEPYLKFGFGPLPWEMQVRDGVPSGRLAEQHWRYHVISFRGNNQILAQIEEACSLAPLEIKIGFVIFHSFGDMHVNPGKYGYMMHSGRLFQMLDGPILNFPFSEVSASDIADIRTLHNQLVRHDHSVVDVRRFVHQLYQLEAVPTSSPLRFLGYFATLEELLTHLPKPTDPYESMTRQIKKKVMLVDHRCNPRIDYSAFAETGAKVETIWTKMYDYRSCLAHGSTPDFGKELRLLGNHDRALSLIKETVKAVLRQALIEPRLIADLKDC